MAPPPPFIQVSALRAPPQRDCSSQGSTENNRVCVCMCWHMNVGIYVYLLLHVCACTCFYVCVYVWGCVYVYSRMCACVPVCACVCSFVSVYVSMHACMYVCVHLYVYVCMCGERESYIYGERQIYFRTLAHSIVGAGKSGICRADGWARDPRKN